jgi:hypothetical protein
MEHIKNYVTKIEAMVAEQAAAKPKARSKGLLSSQSDKKDEKQSDLDIIAKFVYGIRTAKEEMINGNK